MTQALTALIAAFGVLAVAVAAAQGQAREGLHLGLTFWAAAGLLRLSITVSWTALVAAVAVIAVREMVSRVLH
jgi:hypothetical protein